MVQCPTKLAEEWEFDSEAEVDIDITGIGNLDGVVDLSCLLNDENLEVLPELRLFTKPYLIPKSYVIPV